MPLGGRFIKRSCRARFQRCSNRKERWRCELIPRLERILFHFTERIKVLQIFLFILGELRSVAEATAEIIQAPIAW